MSRLGFMVDSVLAESDGKHMVLVDLGYWSEAAAKRYDAMVKAGLSPKRFQRIGNDRLFAQIPPRQMPIIERFPIVGGTTYWRSTHHWRGLADGERMARVP